MPRQVDAHGLGGHLVVANGHEGPAVTGVNQRHNQRNAHARDQERHQGGQVQRHLSLRIFDVEIIERGKQAQHVGAVGDRAQFIPLEDGANDLRKAQRGDRQIVALEAKHRQADQKGENRRHDTRQNERRNHRHGKLNQAAVIVLIHGRALRHRNGQNAIGVGPDEHEARLPQRKQAGKAVEQVHRHRDQRVGRAFLQHRKEHGGRWQNLLQYKHQRIDQNQDHGGQNHAAVRPFDTGNALYIGHDAHLTPCRSSFRQTNLSA